jgi:hypothetical protein
MRRDPSQRQFEALEFHNRYGRVVVDRDAWGPTLTVYVKRSGCYEITVTSGGDSVPIVRDRLTFQTGGKDRVVRLPASMSDECIGRLYLKLQQASNCS